MNGIKFTCLFSALVVATSVFAGGNTSNMDHSTMDHSTMDHSTMDHSTMDHSTMDHSTMDHSNMDHLVDMSSVTKPEALLKPPSLPIAENEADMAIIQSQCVQLGEITFGKDKHWSDCQVTRGRWVGTIELTDMYQAQYCLSNGQEECARRALVLFGNRAYTPGAKLMIQRVDPGTTRYDDPLIVVNDYGRILIVTTHTPEGTSNKNFYLWEKDQWALIDNNQWLKDLSAKLPDGVTARTVGSPNVDTMNSIITLYRDVDADCCPKAGVANVKLGLNKEQFTVKAFTINASN